jgi:uncharacterized protein with PIN domain
VRSADVVPKVSPDGIEPGAGPPALLADAMLGGLARWLRVLDVDTAYEPALDDGELVDKAIAERRILLTRDRRLLERRRARPHLFIRFDAVDDQLRQVVGELGLRLDRLRFFCRCLRCNVELVDTPAAAARVLVPPYVARSVEEFRRCPHCGRIYWRGTHVGRMEAWLERAGLYPPGGISGASRRPSADPPRSPGSPASGASH